MITVSGNFSTANHLQVSTKRAALHRKLLDYRRKVNARPPSCNAGAKKTRRRCKAPWPSGCASCTKAPPRAKRNCCVPSAPGCANRWPAAGPVQPPEEIISSITTAGCSGVLPRTGPEYISAGCTMPTNPKRRGRVNWCHHVTTSPRKTVAKWRTGQLTRCRFSS